MAQLNFKTFKQWGMDSGAVKEYESYLQSTINPSYSVAPWFYISRITLEDKDTEETIESFVKMVSLLKPHIVLFEFKHISDEHRINSLVTDLETTFKYFDYINLYTSESGLIFGLIPIN